MFDVVADKSTQIMVSHFRDDILKNIFAHFCATPSCGVDEAGKEKPQRKPSRGVSEFLQLQRAHNLPQLTERKTHSLFSSFFPFFFF